jgi:phenylacetic acid degradation operon negative regulatory protein
MLDVKPQDLIVSLLGAYARDERRLIWSGGLVQILETFGFSKAGSRIALTRSVHRGLLTPVREGRLMHYALTPKMLTAIAEGDQRIFALGRRRSPHEPWTLLWHFIPADQRHERMHFARRLRFMGFGSPQDGVWLTPHDREAEVYALAQDLGVAEHCSLLIGREGTDMRIEGLAQRTWDLEHLAEQYAAFITEFEPFRAASVQKKIHGVDALHLHMSVAHRFRVFTSIDPVVPRGMMPRPQVRDRAIALFDRIYMGMAEAARSCFDEIAIAQHERSAVA